MSLKDKINNALTEAMKAKDNTRKVPLKLVMAAIKLAEIETKEKLKDADVISLVQKEVKARNESIVDAKKAERDDLIKAAMAEKTVLEEFLPDGLSDEEIETLVKNAITESGASSPADMGVVMKILMPKIKGRADGSQVSQMVRAQLSG
ncbi:MAG: GatB/YqeY domain-containing protein [Chloroflexota bacterium]